MIGWILFGLLYAGIGAFLAWVAVNSSVSTKWYHALRLVVTWLFEVIFFVLFVKP